MGRPYSLELRERVVEARYSVAMAEQAIGDLLRAIGFRHLLVRPRHPNCDEAVQDDFRKPSPSRSHR